VIRSVSFIDAVWGLSMATLAVNTFLMREPGAAASTLALMVLVWGARLGLHLLRRFLRHGEDARYRRMLPDPEDRAAYAVAALWKVFALQGALIMLVSSPMQVGILAAEPGQLLGPWAWPGLALYAVGMVFEVLGDWQLARFKADPANAGKVMDKGLWRYTRHPNYFGDACAWWGVWLVALSVAPAAVVWTLPGPLFLTFTLVKWSGAAMTEAGMHEKYGAEFADYVRRTPAFVPWLPRL
jgi:steroid 5-alpha reductase family enzyme